MSTNIDDPAAPPPTRAPRVAGDSHHRIASAPDGSRWFDVARAAVRVARKAGRDLPLMALVPPTPTTPRPVTDRS